MICRPPAVAAPSRAWLASLPACAGALASVLVAGPWLAPGAVFPSCRLPFLLSWETCSASARRLPSSAAIGMCVPHIWATSCSALVSDMVLQESKLEEREALGSMEPRSLRVGNSAKFARSRKLNFFKGARDRRLVGDIGWGRYSGVPTPNLARIFQSQQCSDQSMSNRTPTSRAVLLSR